MLQRLLMVAAIVFNLAEAQRSFYASRPGSFSKVLPRFRINETTTTTENALQLNVRGKEEEDEEFNFASNLPSEVNINFLSFLVSQFRF